MRGRHMAALGTIAAVAAGGTAVAVGQDTGGTLGSKAVGATSFEVRIKEKDIGCDKPTIRQCFEKPRLGNVTAGTATVFQGGSKVGTAQFANVLTKRGKNDRELFIASILLKDGSITLQGASLGEEDFVSITGGTGAYAGARGEETEKETPGGSRGEFRITVNLKFIP